MTFRALIAILTREYQERYEGNPPPPTQLLREPFVGPYLRVMFPAPVRPLEAAPLCACGHPVSEHPMHGGCASCGCLGETVRTRP